MDFTLINIIIHEKLVNVNRSIMNYIKIYSQLIERGCIRQRNKTRKILKREIGLVEQHHIIPRSINGTDETTNLVFLTPEEHVLAHLLLVKIYPTNQKLIYAANWMTSRVKSNKEYGWVKRQTAIAFSDKFSGQTRAKESKDKQRNTILLKYKNGYVSPRVGENLTTKHKDAISKGNKGKIIPASSRSNLVGYILRYGEELGTRRYQIDSKKKQTNSIEYYIKKYGETLGTEKYKIRCDTISKNMQGELNHYFGKTHSDEIRKKISESNTGRPKIRTEEHNQKIGLAHTGKKQEIVKCPYCNKEGGKSIMQQWHFDNCKYRPSGPTSERKIKPIITCPHCNRSGNGPRMKSDHFDYCRFKTY